ncbi:hypothetical protein PAHAL_8G244300 [Panicum hallii]|jgi:hypothetical protein|uniref:Uncharacterized protein n=1 Tax=Panicum hallii TaxID=206008 RepID=A0A2S3IFG9_9POAL|nr:uncharacterized protein LOC112902256 [Panicum hallii]PAN43552.1 hypothetical protein PAHAL_8G244300 [Panicum hallii]
MEKGGGGGGGDRATSAAGGMCDRFLTFLAKNLTMSRVKSIADGPKDGAGGGHQPTEGGKEAGEEDEFAIPIERAEFDYEFGGHGDGSAATILEESAVATTTARDVPAEQKTGAAADDGPVAVEETTKVRKTVRIKEDRPEQEGAGAPAATLERKISSLFKKRQASASGGGGDEQRVPRRSRMPPVLRVPSNINERSSTFIEERRRGFGGRGGKAAPDK